MNFIFKVRRYRLERGLEGVYRGVEEGLEWVRRDQEGSSRFHLQLHDLDIFDLHPRGRA